MTGKTDFIIIWFRLNDHKVNSRTNTKVLDI
jgi:hypothetical protein